MIEIIVSKNDQVVFIFRTEKLKFVEGESGDGINILNYSNFGPGGIAIRDSKELIEGEARAIAQISETFSARGERQIKFKLHDKVKSLKMLMKHLGLYEEESGRKLPEELTIKFVRDAPKPNDDT